MSDSDASYAFRSGFGDEEIARVEVQGRVLARATRMIFAEAGIRPGMRVLDLGCGTGDSAFVAADLVGPGGWRDEVLGGVEEQAGPRLWAIVEEAGLRRLGMLGIDGYVVPGDEDGLAWMVHASRALEPALVGTGVATAEEIGIETLEQRLRDEWEKTGTVVTAGCGMSAWATTGPE